MTYFTAMVDRQGNLQTFGDLYGLDTRMGAMLFGTKVPFVTPRYDDEIKAMRTRHRPAAPSGAYRVAGEDSWIAISCFTEDEWRGLASVLGLDPLVDPRFATLAARLAHGS